MQSNSTRRKDQTQVALSLPEPFSSMQFAQAAGLTKNGASSQFRRWLEKGWLKKVDYGKWVRTPIFGKTPSSWGGARVGAGAPDARAAKRAYQARWREERRKKLAGLLNNNNNASGTHVVPCQLDYCPNCKTRFYMAKGEQ